MSRIECNPSEPTPLQYFHSVQDLTKQKEELTKQRDAQLEEIVSVRSLIYVAFVATLKVVTGTSSWLALYTVSPSLS